MRLLFGLSPASACKVGLPLPASAAVFARYGSIGHRWYHMGQKRHVIIVMPPFTHPLAPPLAQCRLVEQDQEVDAPDTPVFGWRPPHMSVSLTLNRIALDRPMVSGLTVLIPHHIKSYRAVHQRQGAVEASRPPGRDPLPPRR